MTQVSCTQLVMARLLVVEDEGDLRKILEFNLRQAGHEVASAAEGRTALELARAKPLDLVLLDLMLPDISGTEVCKALRNGLGTQGIGIIILTAKAEEIDRVIGFELGADDYVSKPFSMRELLLRIDAVMRRKDATGVEGALVQFGRLRLDREAYRAWVDDHELDLTALEFKLLVALHDTRNRVQTRSALLDAVWGIEAEITTRTVDTHVKRLREKLGRAGEYIETVRGIGYRFTDVPE